jgi:hypothetical protein
MKRPHRLEDWAIAPDSLEFMVLCMVIGLIGLGVAAC